MFIIPHLNPSCPLPGEIVAAGSRRRSPPATLNLFHNPTSEFQKAPPLLFDCTQILPHLNKIMSSRRNGSSSNYNAKLELKLNLSAPERGRRVESPSRSATVSPTSPPSSCVSSEMVNSNGNSPEATSSMVLVGCPRCLMYVMLSENEPKCPKCKSTVLLDFLHEDNNNFNNNNNNNKSTTSSKRTRKG